MGVLEKIRKRMRYPVVLPNGETIHVRTMTIGEHTRLMRLDKDQQLGFLIGNTILGDNEANLWEKSSTESDEQFSNRVLLECELDVQEMRAVKDAIEKLDRIPKQEVLEKNSPETGTPS